MVDSDREKKMALRVFEDEMVSGSSEDNGGGIADDILSRIVGPF